MQNTYAKAPLRGAFGYANCIFAVIFVKSFGDAENNQNYNLGPKACFWKNHAFAIKSFLNPTILWLALHIWLALPRKIPCAAKKQKKCKVLHLIETVGPRPAAGAAEPGPTVSIKC